MRHDDRKHDETSDVLDWAEAVSAGPSVCGAKGYNLRASAIVMETGGYLGHTAIVDREFGVPTVVNVPGLRSHVHDGDQLRVDGDTGEVSISPPVTKTTA